MYCFLGETTLNEVNRQVLSVNPLIYKIRISSSLLWDLKTHKLNGNTNNLQSFGYFDFENFSTNFGSNIFSVFTFKLALIDSRLCRLIFFS